MDKQQNIFEAIKRVVHDEMQPFREEFNLILNTILISNDKIAEELKDLRQTVIARERSDRGNPFIALNSADR